MFATQVFSCEFFNFLRLPILKNICERLLLSSKSKFKSVTESWLILHLLFFFNPSEKACKIYNSVERKEYQEQNQKLQILKINTVS